MKKRIKIDKSPVWSTVCDSCPNEVPKCATWLLKNKNLPFLHYNKVTPWKNIENDRKTLRIIYPGVAVGESCFVLEYYAAEVHQTKLAIEKWFQNVLKYKIIISSIKLPFHSTIE